MNAKQILEEAGLDQTHWGRIIIQAEERGWFYDYEIGGASNWTTCACGQHNLPKEMYYEFGKSPRDHTLGKLGEKFSHRVADYYFESAAETLILIEDRVAELLADRLSEEKK